MSLDPVNTGLPPGLAASIAGELSSLAHDARELQARLTTGDIVAAIVLPSNGLTDLIKIDGLRVAAELPPTVLPGESIVVEVTGFSDDRILLHIVPDARVPESSPSQLRALPVVPQPPEALNASRDAALRTVATPEVQVQAPRQVVSTRPATGPVAVVEARLAAAHATRSLGSAQQERQQAVAARAPLPAAAVVRQRGAASPAAPLLRPLISPRAVSVPVEPRTAVAPSTALTPAPRKVFTEPAGLLRALQLTLTAGNLETARRALDSPEHLAPALTTLERVLSTASEAQGATARTLLAFVARIEPRSPVLAAQIAAFVDHVVDGREVKLAQLLTAHAQVGAPIVAAGRSPAPSTAAATAAPPPRNESAANDSLASERVAVRQAGVDTDLKSQLLAVAHEATVAHGTDAAAKSISTALGGALTAITALQLNAATALAANPDGLAFWLPVALPDGFARAQIQIDRKTPEAQNGTLDGDNFHIGFVLETQHLGTVAIDLLTVGRSVSVGVKTESERARDAFGSALVQLQQRLEALHYRVAKADAGLAPRGAATVGAQAVADVGKPAPATRLVDLDA